MFNPNKPPRVMDDAELQKKFAGVAPEKRSAVGMGETGAIRPQSETVLVRHSTNETSPEDETLYENNAIAQETAERLRQEVLDRLSKNSKNSEDTIELV